MKVLQVVGARPNFMKAAPILRALRSRPGCSAVLVHTGQHYDLSMSDAFFRDLEMPEPDVHLGVGSASHAVQTARILTAFEPVVEREKPDAVVVVGDVNSTLACALVAAKLVVPVVHVEAGLRSRDRTMPEEINRLLTDAISELLLTPSADADAALRAEGIPAARIRRVGNVMIDSLLRHLPQAEGSAYPSALGLTGQRYAVMTLHRPSNVDQPEILRGILEGLDGLSRAMPVVFPAHPRTVKRLAASGLHEQFLDRTGATAKITPLQEGVILVDPAGYLDFLALMKGACVAITDSGGVQEETTVLGIPCLTVRENTERPVTVTEGTNTVVGTDPSRIRTACAAVLSGRPKKGRVPELWDGHAAERIVDAILAAEFCRD